MCRLDAQGNAPVLVLAWSYRAREVGRRREERTKVCGTIQITRRRKMALNLMKSFVRTYFQPLQLTDCMKDHFPGRFCCGKSRRDNGIHATDGDKLGIFILARQELRCFPNFVAVHRKTCPHNALCGERISEFIVPGRHTL